MIEPGYRAVIQAGGKGNRMRELTQDKIPKPMLLLNGKPMLLWQMENIAKFGIRDFVIIIGHLGEKIEEYFGDGAAFGYRINYIKEREPLGSAGSLYELKRYPAEKYLLIFGDVMFDLDMDRMMTFQREKQADITLLAHPNAHPYDSDVLCIDSFGCVEGILSKKAPRNQWYHNCVNAGIYILRHTVIDNMRELVYRDLEKDVVAPLIKTGMVFAYSTPEYVKDAGTPERFETVCREQADGIWERKCLKNKQRCIFLDRDGTINKFCGIVCNESQFELEDYVAEAIRLINQSGYLAIVVTNQPVIARGDCSLEELDNIHSKMETLLGAEGAYLDAIFYCPHHPDRGYPGERLEYKIKCNCRKPGIGLIERAVERFHIDVKKSYMVGDTTMDMMTGVNAGMHTVLVHTGEGGQDGKFQVKAEIEADNLLEAVRLIL